MIVRLHPHAISRLSERGATEKEVIDTVETGEEFPAKYDRTGFRKNFVFNGKWQNRHYATKQVEAYAIKEKKAWLVITVVVKYF